MSAPWASYAYASAIDHFSWWCETYAVQSIDQFAGKPLVLEDWQKEFMGEALSVNEDGSPYWKFVVLVVPRKNGKTSLLAAYADYHADQDDGSPEVLLCASSDKQAGRLFDSVVAFNHQSDYLTERFNIANRIGEITRADDGAKILRMSSDAGRLHGYNPSLVIIDELHAWTTPKLKSAWGALTTGGGARKSSQVFVITTAGEAKDRADGLLGQMVDTNEEDGEVEKRGALTISRNHQARVLIYNYSASVEGKNQKEDRKNFAAIRAANPASWISDAFLKEQMANPGLSDAAFLQLHACVWVDSADTFIPVTEWRGLGTGATIGEGRKVAIGIDGSFVGDTTVVAWASRDDEGRIDVDARIYSVRADAPHHVYQHGGKIKFTEVEAFIIEQFQTYEVVAAGYDPRYLNRSVELIEERLPEASLIVMEPNSRTMRDAIAMLHREVLDGTIRHRGDKQIEAHFGACRGEQDDRGWVISKKKHQRPIDAVPAIAMAVYLVNTLEPVGDAGYEVFDYNELLKESEEEWKDLYQS